LRGLVRTRGYRAGLRYTPSDPVSAQRALESGAQAVRVSKNGVDAVYTADPRVDPAAQRLEDLTFEEALKRELMVVDQTAFSLCKDNALPMRAFGVEGDENLRRAIVGEELGTLIHAADDE